MKTVTVEELEESEWDIERDRILAYIDRRIAEATNRVGFRTWSSTVLMRLRQDLAHNEHRKPVPTNADLWK